MNWDDVTTAEPLQGAGAQATWDDVTLAEPASNDDTSYMADVQFAMSDITANPEFAQLDEETQKSLLGLQQWSQEGVVDRAQEYNDLATVAPLFQLSPTGGVTIDEQQYAALTPEQKELANRRLKLYNANVEEQARMQSLREWTEGGLLERVGKSAVTGVGDTLAILGAGLTEGAEGLERVGRQSNQLQQAFAQTSPGAFDRAATSAASSVAQALYFTPTGGTPGVIASFVTDSLAQNYAAAKDNGFKDNEALAYASMQATLEGGIAALFSSVGAGGLESVGKWAGKGTAKEFARTLAKQWAFENVEEVATSYSQAALAVATNVDPKALDNPAQLIGDTMLATTLAIGAGAGTVHGSKAAVDFISNPTRRNAFQAKLARLRGDKMETPLPTQADRKRVAEKAKAIIEHKQYAEGFRQQLADVAEAGRMTPEQARYLYYLTEARAKASGESLGEYLQSRGVRVENAKWEDFANKGNRRAIDESQSQKSGQLRRNAEIEFTQEGETVVRAFETATFNSMIHELGHLFRRDLAGKEMDAGARWAGAKKQDGEWVWSRDAEEKFARGFERYMTDGTAPSKPLGRLFEKIAGWMRNVYASLRREAPDVNISPEMRGVYDSLFLGADVAQDAMQAAPAMETQATPGAPQEAAQEPTADTLASENDLGPIGIKNESIDQDRQARGLDPLMTRLRQSHQQAWDSAMRKINSNSAWQDSLIDELRAKPRPATDTETMALLHKQAVLKTDAESLYAEKLEAENLGDTETAQQKQAEIDLLEAQRQEFERVLRDVGSEQGRALAARKAMVNDDFTLATMMLEARMSKGDKLSPEESSQIAELQGRLESLQAQYDALLSQQVETEEQAGVSRAMRDASRARAKRGSLTTDQERDAALSSIKAKAAKNDPRIKSQLDKLARIFWRQGIRQQDEMLEALHNAIAPIMGKDWTPENTARAWSGYGDFRELTKGEIDEGLRDLKGQTQQLLKMEAILNKKPLEKTGVERRTPSQKERELIRQVNELKRRYGVVVTDPAKQLKSALDARKTYYRNRMADLQREIETRQRAVPDRSAPPSDPELEGLLKQYETVKQQHEEIFGKPELTDQQRLDRAIKAAERNQAMWDERVKSARKGVFDYETRKKRQYNSAELDAIRARAAEAKAAYEELRDIGDPEWRSRAALKALKSRVATQIADYRERLANGDFETRKREPIKLDKEAAQAKAALDMVRQEWNAQREKWRWDRLSWTDKLKESLLPIYDILRNAKTTGEFSFVLRQGKLQFLTNPLATARTVNKAFRALADEETSLALDNAIFQHERFDEAQAAGVHFSQEDSSLTNQEEFVMSKWLGKLNPKNRALRRLFRTQHAFNRAGRVYMNRLRFDAYLRMVDAWNVDTDVGREAVARFVNESTGRGGLGPAERHAIALNRMFFSPRYFTSRLQLLAGHSLWSGDAASRKAILWEYGKSLLGLGVYYSLIAGAMGATSDDELELETDPRSSDFLKLRYGDTRIDPLAGLAQTAVFLSRLATGEKVTQKGDVRALRGDERKFGSDDTRDVLWRFVEGKLHPALADTIKLAAGEDIVGQPVTLATAAESFIPITWGDVAQVYKEKGVDEATVMSVLAFFGEGIQQYGKQEAKDAK